MQLNKILINQFLDAVGLLTTTSPSTYTDLKLGMDRFPKETDLSTIFMLASEEEKDYLHRILIANWLFDDYNFTGFNWGWYMCDKEDTWKELPYGFQSDKKYRTFPSIILNPLYSNKGFTKNTYHIKGLIPTPDNIVLLENNDIFYDTLQSWCFKIREWYEVHYNVSHDTVSLIEVADFMKQINEKLIEASNL